MDEQLLSSLELLKSTLRASNTTWPGAALAQLLNTKFPEIDYRVPQGEMPIGTLRSFVETQLADTLTVGGKSGMDVLYVLVDTPKESACIREEDAWRSFVSPASQGTLALIPPTMNLRFLDGQAPRGSVIVPRVTQVELNRIASEFVAEIPANEISALVAAELTGLAARGAYGQWSQLLRTAANKYFRAWPERRRSRLLALFEERLNKSENALLVAPVRSNVMQQARVALKVNNNFHTESNSVEARLGIPAVRLTTTEARKPYFRDCVLATIAMMDDDALRELRLPAGQMWDAWTSLDSIKNSR